ncbi:undecaprenyl-diphosphate phosphatase [Candidatus Palibaumannia cicadellinicola]|uniref:Undecaprenyl-diphosphatase n=1 Tax=Baumannia cicadellinicola subsp. Homalodisca coagulata TaxID=374463 RepID=UPPP_BAUCH|nr:undecaprenyl-diphosphate phosphatase [Candidatus Baumannia cicadellinicola]Q1LSL8.1 RecName: Full=Undecaprenyl-diphosphatase; AltName: Full=Bacitracin resistance protein; AltName: Full=Undecaprenyl pyrophosphate phosphatase [Baumannia cicadellinicola str. Hc (Homalodisca coagulata)]ABF13789.1 putative undecaprenol kinase [Baumannia cicadellinicola str. Hc (Homalodisca coagulata)]MBS0032517.1 undecaprenyl-diphosphate phosphatase [Candidatus Baumannia cicadellinicola]MCJ7461961.1 undecaprenyl-
MVDIYGLVVALILGIVEGLTEFLPVSSTGHMILVSYMLGFNNDKTKIFEVLIQLGSILAVIIICKQRWFLLFGLNLKKWEIYQHNINHGSRLHLYHIILGLIPSSILGLMFYEQIKSFFEPKYVMYSLILGSLLLLISQLIHDKKPRATCIDDISYLQAFLIGCFQCFALLPGFSRSGATISGGMLVGVSSDAAFEFSFLLAVPMIFGATILDLYRHLPVLSLDDIPMFIIGFITAFLVALITIKLFWRIIKGMSFIPFVLYRFLLVIVFYLILI